MKRVALALALLSAAAARAQSPCATPTPQIQPCTAAALDAPPPLATIDGAPITIADLDDATRKTIAALDTAEAEARQKASREDRDDVLLAREAKRRGTTVGNLIATEIVANVHRPTDSEIAAEIAAHSDKYKRAGDDAPHWAARTLLNASRRDREREFIASLEKRFDTPVVASTLHTETALADARINALEAQRSAIDSVVHDRLLRAEAANQGITPDELTRREVTAKIAAPTDAELKAEWQARKPFFDDDFDKARDDVRKWVDRERQQAAEKAFDDRLRAGHDIRILFDVPIRPSQNVDDDRAPATGDRDAKVTLVEFGDFECPPCAYMSGIVDEVLRPYGNRVRYVFRPYPLATHPHAWMAAQAALAANAQGKFFEYAHILFANQNALDDASLKKYATQIGLDRAKFDTDLNSGRFAATIADNQWRADRAGFRGTPTFFLNGVRLGNEGYSAEGLRAAIDRALATAK